MVLYKVGTQSSVLINQVSLFQGCPLRGVAQASLGGNMFPRDKASRQSPTYKLALLQLLAGPLSLLHAGREGA